jgi:hypothetical protein
MVRWSEILRGAFTKFLPGALGLMAVVLALEFSRGVRLSPLAAQVFSVEVLGLAAGYAGALALMRARLRSDVAINTKRSAIVGVAAATGLLALMAFIGGPWHVWSLGIASFATGAISAGLMFLPWLTRARGDVANVKTSDRVV